MTIYLASTFPLFRILIEFLYDLYIGYFPSTIDLVLIFEPMSQIDSLPKQFVCPPSTCAPDMSIAFMTHFVQPPPGFCICESPFSNKGGEIIHALCAHGSHFFVPAKYVDFLIFYSRGFHDDPIPFCLFPRILSNPIGHI